MLFLNSNSNQNKKFAVISQRHGGEGRSNRTIVLNDPVTFASSAVRHMPGSSPVNFLYSPTFLFRLLTKGIMKIGWVISWDQVRGGKVFFTYHWIILWTYERTYVFIIQNKAIFPFKRSNHIFFDGWHFIFNGPFWESLNVKVIANTMKKVFLR